MKKFFNYSYKNLKKFTEDAFFKFGFSKKESEIITDVLLTSDIYGIDSHGIQRLVRYHKSIEQGLINVRAKPEIICETPVSAVVDGHNGMGQLIGYEAMMLAIKKANKTGIAIVSVRNSNHYGIAGYYANMASKEGLIGISMTNSKAIMVPTFGKKAMLGSNPIAVSMPAEPYDFFFDSSTTVVTRGKLELYNKYEKSLPDSWAINAMGKTSNDAHEVLESIASGSGGGILPLGGENELYGSHKGYGYGMLCEIFTSVLSMGDTSSHTYKDGKGGICHCFIAINPKIFGSTDDIKKHLSDLLLELRESPKAEGAERIYTHGEKEHFSSVSRMKNGIDVDVNTVTEMVDLCCTLDMDVEEYLGLDAAQLPRKKSTYRT